MTAYASSVTALRPLDMPATFKEAGLTAFIMVALAFSLVGFEVRDVPGGIAIDTRFDDVVAIGLVGFVGRIALILLREHRPIPVIVAAPILAAIMLGVLLSETFFGPATGSRLKALIPFSSPVVLWGMTAVAIILAVRAAWAVSHMSSQLSTAEREKRMDRLGARVQRAARLLGPSLLAGAIIFPFTPAADRQLLDIAILVLTYVMLGWGLNIVVGLAGLLDLGYVAFYAVGAYSFALLATDFGVSFWVCLPFAGLMSACAGVILGFPVLRLRGDYLAIVTLGFGEMVRIILLNWYSFTNGPDGISQIPRPSFFGLAEFSRSGEHTFHELFALDYSPLQRIVFLYYLILGMALVVNVFTLRIRKLPIGRAWEALREDEIACHSLGINPRNTKLTAFGIGAMFAGFAGSFFATRQGFISPESFTFIESAVILAIVVLGGFGSQIGVVVAAILLIGLPEFFRELQQYRMLAFGMAMVLIMLWRPAGLLAHREPTIRLLKKKPAGEAAA
jgi:branched-chain amino acid transport system permease protein